MLGWCMQCRKQSDVTVTAERGGYLMHYAACWDHIEDVCAMMRQQNGRPKPKPLTPRGDVIDAASSSPVCELDA